jgi:predicted RNA binding protein YcfA (HicA-like mRNA interferase family)
MDILETLATLGWQDTRRRQSSMDILETLTTLGWQDTRRIHRKQNNTEN